MSRSWTTLVSGLLTLLAFVALPSCIVITEQIPETVPDFFAAKFSHPTQIDSPLFPLTPGTTLTYEGDTADGHERVVFQILDETRVVTGVTCRVVRDRVYLDGVLTEDTHDFHAQDDDGNVWYFGEEVNEFEYDNQGRLIATKHDGAWETGQDVAHRGKIGLAGFQMKAAPAVGDVYHQEFYPGVAEDMAEVVARNVRITLSDGTHYTCLKTRESSALEPTAIEFKYYAPGVGLVREESADRAEKSDLVRIQP